MQKFTRPLTREIEVAGERLALTFSDQGMSVRPVGSRKPPREISWGAILRHLADPASAEQAAQSSEDLTAVVERLKTGPASKPAATPAPAADKAPPAPPKASELIDQARTMHAGQADNLAPAPKAAHPAGAVAEGLNPFLNRLETWLSHHRPQYFKGLHPSAGPTELESLQANLGTSLPAELHTLLTWHNGQSAEIAGHLEQNWDLMSAGDIAAAKRDLDGAEGARRGWQSTWIPFLQDEAGDYVCLDTSLPGNPVRQVWQGPTDHPVAAPSLAAWLEDFVTALERGDYQEDKEHGSMIRQQEEGQEGHG